MAGGTQIFVRNREGKVFGPIEPSTVELLIEGGILQGLLQVSTDGESYALPHRFPEIRDFFPRHLWGDDNRRDVALDSEGSPPGPAGGVSDAPSVAVTRGLHPPERRCSTRRASHTGRATPGRGHHRSDADARGGQPDAASCPRCESVRTRACTARPRRRARLARCPGADRDGSLVGTSARRECPA